MIFSNFEWTLLRSNIYWWLVFLLIVPLNALANYQRSYWCINCVNDTGNTCIAGVIDSSEVGDISCPVSMTPVMHDVTGRAAPSPPSPCHNYLPEGYRWCSTQWRKYINKSQLGIGLNLVLWRRNYSHTVFVNKRILASKNVFSRSRTFSASWQLDVLTTARI
jgi:hypothetical protein